MTERSDAITPEGLEALEAELAELEGPLRREQAERIKAARELGDLKENAEYHIAKEQQAMLETRIANLRERRRSAVVTEVATATDEVAFGSTVTVIDEESGDHSTYTIVGATEADAATGRLSAESPVARALLGTKVGKVAVVALPRGEKRLRVDSLG